MPHVKRTQTNETHAHRSYCLNKVDNTSATNVCPYAKVQKAGKRQVRMQLGLLGTGWLNDSARAMCVR